VLPSAGRILGPGTPSALTPSVKPSTRLSRRGPLVSGISSCSLVSMSWPHSCARAVTSAVSSEKRYARMRWAAAIQFFGPLSSSDIYEVNLTAWRAEVVGLADSHCFSGGPALAHGRWITTLVPNTHTPRCVTGRSEIPTPNICFNPIFTHVDGSWAPGSGRIVSSHRCQPSGVAGEGWPSPDP
jgi:hypothetical protein